MADSKPPGRFKTGIRPAIVGMRLGRRLRRLLKLRVWLAETIRPTDLQILLLWAGVIGVVGALTAHFFREATDALHYALTQQPGNYVDSFRLIPWWQRLLVPGLGGAAAGTALYFGSRMGKSQRTSDYMEAIVVRDGRVAFRASLVKSLSAFFSGGSGASIGREGPLVQLSAMLASLPGRLFAIPLPRRRQLVACGAAAGIASAYNAPIGGALFVAEIILGSLSMESFGPLVVSSVVATLVTRSLESSDALYWTPSFTLHSHWEVLLFLLLGIICGLLAPLYIRFLRTCENIFQRLPIHRIGRLTLGGLIVGGLAILRPEVCGNGNSVVYSILHDPWAWNAVMVVLGLKLLATGATFGSGAVGGVFTPTLLTGAAMGYLFGFGILWLWPNSGVAPSAYALVGMGSFLAAATGAPVMAIIMLFELTLNYDIILPLMPACVFGYYVCRTFESRFLYQEALERKGAAIVAEQLATRTVTDLMRRDPVRVRATSTFQKIGETFLQNRFNNLYVVDDDDNYLGVVALHDVKGYLDKPELACVLVAADLVRTSFPAMTLEHPLEDALRIFEVSQSERLPIIVSEDDRRLVGSLSKTDFLLHLLGRWNHN